MQKSLAVIKLFYLLRHVPSCTVIVQKGSIVFSSVYLFVNKITVEQTV